MGMSQQLCGGQSSAGTRRPEMTEGGSEGGQAEARAGTVHSEHDEAWLAGLSRAAAHPDFREAFWLQRDRGWGGVQRAERRARQG